MRWLTKKEEERLWEEKDKSKVTCKCGHVVFMSKSGRKICTWCNNYVFKDKQTEFEYRMKENLIRERRNME